LVNYGEEHVDELLDLRVDLQIELYDQKKFDLRWELDTTSFKTIDFEGYEAVFEESKLDQQTRLRYDRDKPYSKKIPYYNRYKPTVSVEAPEYYVVPQAWREVIERLANNNVQMDYLQNDTILEVEAYYATKVLTVDNPYEGRYLHHGVEVEKQTQSLQFRKGDFLIPTAQRAKRFIVEVLEPQGVDSYFAWGFFDSVLQQKEWFSAYIFEEEAVQLLEDNPKIQTAFEAELEANPEMKGNHWSQLYWLYKHSDNFEKSYNRIPVYRLR